MRADSINIIVLIYLTLLSVGSSSVYCKTCKEILDLPSTTLSLNDLKNMKQSELVDCVPYLGKEPLNYYLAAFMWETLIEFYGGVASIPQNKMAQLRWITKAIKPDDYANITIDTIEVVKNFGFNYGLDFAMLKIIADRVRVDYSDKAPEDYTYYDLKALNQILCAFNRSEIERIHPSVYRESASFIGKLKFCNNTEAMTAFATLAVHEDAFGPAQDWSRLVKSTVGKVAEFVGGVANDLEGTVTNQEEINRSDEYGAEIKFSAEIF